jgi:hypothetical protein
VRCFATLCLVCLFVSTGWAQKQERSLVDRLLRPDMELKNSNQGKKFITSSVPIERRRTVGTFYLQPKPAEKPFAGTPAVTTSGHLYRSFYDGSHTGVPNQIRNANTSSALQTSSVRDIHDTSDARKVVAGRDFADQHQFREQGKSQRSLDRQNLPLTIDQVRELLNKNK